MARDDDRDLDESDHDEPALPAFRALFADTASGATDDVNVTIPGIDAHSVFGPVLWTQLPGPVYPTAGDPAWVLEVTDTDGVQDWIVLHWQPA